MKTDAEFLPVYADAFNMLCGDFIGAGIHRKVYACKLRPELVVKVESEVDYRNFANVKEMQFWNDNEHHKAVSKWLAPCEYLSPDGRILLQRRVKPVDPTDKLPAKLPKFITDRKYKNFGWFEGRLVACDYGLHVTTAPLALTKSEFWE